MSNSTVDFLQTWLSYALNVYTLLIIAWIVLSYFRLPYNRFTAISRTFLEDTVQPFVGLFRRLLPRVGMFDFSPMLAIISLQIAGSVLANVLGSLRPGA